MNEPRTNELLDKLWKRPLSPEEKQWLKAYRDAHPEAAATIEEELVLARLLRERPDIPLPSNFTARVLAAVRVEKSQRSAARSFPTLNWIRRLAWAELAIVVGALGFYGYHAIERREQAESLAAFSSSVGSLTNLALLRDFDAIQRLSQAPEEKEIDELLAALE